MLIEVRKLDLIEGEEVLELGNKIMQALAQNRKKLKRSLSLRGIFNDHIVARDMESGKMFRMTMKRGEDGSIELGDMEEVRQVYVPAKKKKQEDGSYVCAKCGQKTTKAGECPKCGAEITEAMKEKKKVEKSMDEYTEDAQADLALLESITEVMKSDAEYIDLEDPADVKKSLFADVINQ